VRHLFPIASALLGAWLLQATGPFDARDVYSKKTDDLLLMCANGGAPCRDFINDVLQALNVAAVIRPVGNYKGCAPAPLSSEQVDQVVLWLLSRAQLASGYAAEDIGTAAQDIWPCK
jgi:hypothetical protein